MAFNPRHFDASRDMALAERTLRRGGATPSAAGSHYSTSTPAGAAALPHASSSSMSGGLHPGIFEAEQFAAAGSTQYNLSNTAPIFPFNIDATKQLLHAVEGGADPPMHAAGARPTVDLGPDALLKLQLDVSDYVSMLDSTMRTMFSQPNARLATRLRETSDIPLTFLYFRTQQKMMKLTGALTIQRERELLAKLAHTFE